MDRQEAERIFDAGKETVIETLMVMDARIRELERSIAALNRNSSNSSRPPSSDRPGTKKGKRNAKLSKRQQGGQPGHKGKKRDLLPAEEMDKIHDIFPKHCESCQRPLSSENLSPFEKPLRHQVFDIPEIVPTKEEYRCHSLTCQCGHRTTACLPSNIAQSNFGPRVHAAIAYLTSAHRCSRRGIAEIMENFFNIDISTGAICKAAERASEACVPVFEVIKRYTVCAPTLNIDETGWKSKGNKRYLWTFVSPLTVLFTIDPSRGAKVLKKVLGESFAGIISSDDHSAYNSYHKKGRRQLCWAHIIRKFKGLKDGRSSPDAYLFSKTMLKEIGRIFSKWHAFQNSECTRKQLRLTTAHIRGRMKWHCNHYLQSKDTLVETRAKMTLRNWEHLFTFLKCEGVEPTNNIAERAIRPAVQWRKVCFGSQSDAGERFTERLLTVIRTCQMHGVNSFEFLVKIMRASPSEQHHIPPLPFLLPD